MTIGIWANMSGIIELMKAMGYEDVSTGGVCFGLAQGLIQAHLNGEKDWIEIHKMLASLPREEIFKLVGFKNLKDIEIEKDAEGPTFLDTGAIKRAEGAKILVEKYKKQLKELEQLEHINRVGPTHEELKRRITALKFPNYGSFQRNSPMKGCVKSGHFLIRYICTRMDIKKRKNF